MHFIINENPLITFGITVCFSIVIFFVIRLLLCLLYKKTLMKWGTFQSYIEKLRSKGLPYYAKYGLIGLVVFVALPIPGTGVYGATILSWLLNIKWSLSLLAILPGAIISNGIIVLAAFGIVQGIS
ncbi:MAG TPA: small multi-drug export protein [Dehalococcoidia bacterium]|nr:small multi-drug export protein [Dehalococcoidia bacterium]